MLHALSSGLHSKDIRSSGDQPPTLSSNPWGPDELNKSYICVVRFIIYIRKDSSFYHRGFAHSFHISSQRWCPWQPTARGRWGFQHSTECCLRVWQSSKTLNGATVPVWCSMCEINKPITFHCPFALERKMYEKRHLTIEQIYCVYLSIVDEFSCSTSDSLGPGSKFKKTKKN